MKPSTRCYGDSHAGRISSEGKPRRDLVVDIGVVVTSLVNMIAAMLQSESARNAAFSFCEQVMLAKETVERER